MSRDAKHSPTPWRVENTEVFGNADRMIYDADGNAVAAVYRKEDAPVIAAAPELLETSGLGRLGTTDPDAWDRTSPDSETENQP